MCEGSFLLIFFVDVMDADQLDDEDTCFEVYQLMDVSTDGTHGAGVSVTQVPLPVPGVCAMSARAFGKRFAACPEPEFSLPGIRELPALSFPLGLLLR